MLAPRRLLAAVLTALLTVSLTVGAVAFLSPSASAKTGGQAADPTPPNHLVISAVFGSDGGAFGSDWVQLYNPTDSSISLGTISGSTVTPNYYQCYRSISGTSCSSMKLYGTVLPHHYFLIWDGHNAGSPAQPPSGVVPDLNFAHGSNDTGATANPADPSGQNNNGFGGYSTGGQILLLNAASNGVYTGTGDLASAAAQSAGVVDAVSWTKYASPTYTQAGSAEGGAGNSAKMGTSNMFVSARTFTNGIPVDTDNNANDFTAVQSYALTSQKSSRVAVAAIPDTTIARNGAMQPIQVQGSNGIGTLSYAATGLPAGVSLDPSSGVISGTPTATGSYPVTVTVSDQTPGTPDTATTSFTITVVASVVVAKIPDVTIHRGDALTPIQVQASGGTPPFTYAATGLPAGTSIDPGTGVISGTPTTGAGRYKVHVVVTDSATPTAATGTADFTIAELPASSGPGSGDPLTGLRINEVKATGTPANDFVELYNTGAAVTGAQVDLVDAAGDAYPVPTQDIGAKGFVVVEGSALDAAGLDLTANDTLYLTDMSDATVLDQTTWTSFQTTSWGRYPDGTGDFVTSTSATKGTANTMPQGADTDHLVIAAVFGANSDTVRFSNDWVELYNPTDQPINLGTNDTSTTPSTVTPNYTLCYRSYSATGACVPANGLKLYGTVQPHHYFFVWLGNAHSPVDDGTYPAGLTPDLDFAVGTPTNGNQAGPNMGGCNTGGQMELLDTSKGTAPINGDLSSAAAKAAGEVDGVGWMNASTNQPTAAESKGQAKVTGLNSGTNNTCVIQRTFAAGFPIDSDVNSADFTTTTDLASFSAHSQASDHVSITPIDDADISVGEAIDPIQVQAKAVYGALGYAATGLPDGVTIDPTSGVISGTPSTSDALQDYPVTVTVNDAVASDTATATFTFSLSKGVRLDHLADVSVAKGTALPAVTVKAHGGMAPYTYTATGLPAGVTIDSASGVISGTPTDALGRYTVHVTATDSATGADTSSASEDFAIVETPSTGGPAAGDPLAGLRINEVEATGTPANDFVELYNTGAAVTGASVVLENGEGGSYQVPTQDVAANGYVVVEGKDLDAAGLDLAAQDTLYLAEPGGTPLDQTSWTAYQPTSWARSVDGTGDFGTSAYPTKGSANPGAPVIKPNDLFVSEVNYDNNSTDYYEYSEVTNTTNHPIDFDAYGLTVSKSGVTMTLHSATDTSAASPHADPVIKAHGTLVMWWDENQYLGVKTTSQFRSNYGIPSSVPVVLVQGFSSLANSGGDHSYDISIDHGSTKISQANVDTPCAANTLNGTAVCPATNGNYAEHYQVPADRTNAVAAVWYNSISPNGDDVNHALKKPLSTPGTVDLEQVGFTRAVTFTSVDGDTVTLHNTGSTTADLSGYVLQKNRNGATYTFPAGTTVAAGADLVVHAADSGLTFGDDDYASLLAPPGYAYTDGIGIADTTGPFLFTLSYDASSGQPPVIDPTTGLPLPPAGGLYRPAGLLAGAGRLYVSNTGDNLVAALANGSNTIVAGSLSGYGDQGDEGPATDAQLYQPNGMAQDADGDVFIADTGDDLVREITPDGNIHLFAGTGSAGKGDITPSSTAKTVALDHPDDVAVDSAGDVFIADTDNNRVLEVAKSGAVTLVAGTGTAGYSGDGHAATAARMTTPTGIALDAHDNLYVADSANNLVRRVDAGTGVITTVAGNFQADQASDGLGGYSGDGGPATKARLNDPQGLDLDGAGDLFIADTFNNAVREVTPDGTISTVVNESTNAGAENTSPTGSGAVPTSTQLNTPYAVAVDRSTGTLYVADTRNNAVAQVINVGHSGDADGPTEPAGQLADQVRYETDLAQLTADQAKTVTDQAALTAAQTQLSTDQPTLTAAQTKLGNDQAALASDQGKLSTDQATLGTDQATLAGAQSTQADAMKKQTDDAAALAAARTRLTGAQKALSTDRTSLAAAQQQLKRANATLARDQKQLAAAKKKERKAKGHQKTAAKKKVAKLTRQVKAAKKAAASARTTVSNRQAQVNAAQRTVTTDQKAVTTDQAAVATDQQAVTQASNAVAADQSAVTADQAAVNADQSAVNADQSAVTGDQTAVSSAQSTVDADQAAVTAAQNAVTADQNAVAADQAAVAADLAALQADA